MEGGRTGQKRSVRSICISEKRALACCQAFEALLESSEAWVGIVYKMIPLRRIVHSE